MTRFIFTAMFAVSLSSSCFGQHSDIEFGLDDLLEPTEIEVESDEFNNEGIKILEGEFEGLGSDLFTESPGFITAADEGLVVNEGDRVFVRILDAGASDETSVGAGFVNFYDPANPTAGVQAFGNLAISAQTGPTTVFDGTTVSGSDSFFLAAGSDGTVVSNPPAGEAPEVLGLGEIHNHLLFDLQNENSTPDGAIGLLIQFEVDLVGTDSEIDVTSDPFFLIFNNGLDDDVFEEEALMAFGVGVPLIGDFDSDGDVDIDDINAFAGNFAATASGDLAQLDLNGDGEITSADLEVHVTTYVQTANGQTGTFLGDLNLDGSVDVLGDAFTLIGSLGSAATSYAQGDINLDGTVDVLEDAFELIGNLGSSNEL